MYTLEKGKSLYIEYNGKILEIAITRVGEIKIRIALRNLKGDSQIKRV